MKKIDKTNYFERLTYSKLYLDDLERIVETMEEQSLDVRFKDDEYEYDSLKEIVEKRGEKKSHIEIIGIKSDEVWRSVSLNIDGRKLFLHADGDLELTWHKIKEYIKSKTPWYSRFIDVWMWGCITFVILGQYTSFIDAETKKLIAPTWFNSLVSVVALIFAFVIFRDFSDRGVFIVYRHENKNFFVKNGDKILLIIIGALIGVFGKYIAKFLFGIE